MIGVVGTSPRTRGKPSHQMAFTLDHMEHPRARGENTSSAWESIKYHGTSPRTRGKLHCRPRSMVVAGNIPAHAGKTLAILLPAWVVPEHPRARGENLYSCRYFCRYYGTSPRTRGKHLQAQQAYSAPRNIPAHAGKTPLAAVVANDTAEHPRARGENLLPFCLGIIRMGTSPRTRGKQYLDVLGEMPAGNIPAHAGKTL